MRISVNVAFTVAFAVGTAAALGRDCAARTADAAKKAKTMHVKTTTGMRFASLIDAPFTRHLCEPRL
jgi:hypothetical protein